MMAARLRVVLEFNVNKKEDYNLYKELIKYSNPGATTKDMLKGILPLPRLNEDKN